VRLSPLGTSATVGLLYQPQMIDDDYEAVGGMRIGRGNRSTRRKPAPVPLCPPQIPHDLGSNPGRRSNILSAIFPSSTNSRAVWMFLERKAQNKRTCDRVWPSVRAFHLQYYSAYRKSLYYNLLREFNCCPWRHNLYFKWSSNQTSFFSKTGLHTKNWHMV
jgi:hypothetical protein